MILTKIGKQHLHIVFDILKLDIENFRDIIDAIIVLSWFHHGFSICQRRINEFNNTFQNLYFSGS